MSRWHGPPPPDGDRSATEEELLDGLREIQRLVQGVYTSPPPAPQTRNPNSDPNEQRRRELTQCQYCYGSKARGAKLSKCGACRVAIYCSKECQRNAWPTHKPKCKINQRMQEHGPDLNGLHKLLRAFTTKHRPSLRAAAVRALALWDDPTRSEREYLAILLRRRPDSTRPETAFFAYEARLMPLGDLHPLHGEDVREQMQTYKTESKRQGGMGASFVMLTCPDENLVNIMPTAFSHQIYGMKEDDPFAWREQLLTHMNEGIVL